MSWNTLLVEDANTVRTITINRPDKMNALNHETLSELRGAIAQAAEDEGVYVIVLTGAGEKAFVAGADIAELGKETAATGQDFAAFGQAVFNLIEQCPKPVIAAVNGFALGGGCELAMACHIRIASANAKFGQPEVNLGIIPGYGGTQRLPRLVGWGKAAELTLTGNIVKAEEALQIGLVNQVVEQGGALAASQAMAGVIASKGPLAVRYALDALRAVHETGLNAGLNREAAIFGLCCGTEDFKEGTTAFLEKRTANFTAK